jgi:hypothetical protein
MKYNAIRVMLVTDINDQNFEWFVKVLNKCSDEAILRDSKCSNCFGFKLCSHLYDNICSNPKWNKKNVN